ncbi:hypothetical protein GJ496_011295 [Pomphorhynchus laevis]|nr:hypothetical protein GJ496_011295 [Pomphorhynchus laevis]
MVIIMEICYSIRCITTNVSYCAKNAKHLILDKVSMKENVRKLCKFQKLSTIELYMLNKLFKNAKHTEKNTLDLKEYIHIMEAYKSQLHRIHLLNEYLTNAKIEVPYIHKIFIALNINRGQRLTAKQMHQILQSLNINIDFDDFKGLLKIYNGKDADSCSWNKFSKFMMCDECER